MKQEKSQLISRPMTRQRILERVRHFRSDLEGRENHKPYLTDVSDEEWSFVTPFLTLMNEDTQLRC